MTAESSNPKRELRRARITALVLGSLTVLCLIFLVYAFIQKTHAEVNEERSIQLQLELDSLQQELEDCMERDKKQNLNNN